METNLSVAVHAAEGLQEGNGGAEGFYGEVTLPLGNLEHAVLLLLPVHGLLRVQQPPGGHPDQSIHLQVRGMGRKREHGIAVCHWGRKVHFVLHLFRVPDLFPCCAWAG